MNEDSSSVRVAVRIRPQLPKEIIDACKTCITKTADEPQVWLGSNKAFTYDYVYEPDSLQEEVYEETVKGLIEGCFEGYNATVLAYGQTGSGKTYTMGTGFELSGAYHQMGIVPRAVKQLFSGISQRIAEAQENDTPPPEFKVSATFLELYNEEILDLFDNTSCAHKTTSSASSSIIGGLGKRSTSSGSSGIRIHEDSNGNINTVGVTSRTVRSEEETMQCLKNGAFNRTTASTNMNDQSSRSHAIFTLCIQQQRHVQPESSVHDQSLGPEIEMLAAKFHFVDLAGSERLKRTGATGERAKEGISINCGLLALGNVISALGDTTKKVSHVPYRDSKLTRLLQDSLGGNSRTVMIACVSPSDRDFMETLNTLKYANRARNIKNKVTANQDKTSRTILLLRQEIQNLQLELIEYKQGKKMVGEDGFETTNDMYHENSMLSKENQNMRTRIKALQETIEVLTVKNSQLLAERGIGEWIQGSKDNDISVMIEKYILEIEELRAKLCESEKMCEQLRKESAKAKRLSMTQSTPCKSAWSSSIVASKEDNDNVIQDLINSAKKEVAKERKLQLRKSSKALVDEDKDVNSAPDDEEWEDESESESESDEEDTESDDKARNEINQELAELTSEISLKQKLIEELETSQKRLQTMKFQYETKLIALEQRIQATQDERDKVLKNMTNTKGAVQGPERVQKIKQEYEEKLEKLESEVKKLKAAQKEHAKLLKNQSQYQRQMDKLKSELMDMKRSKVALVQKMKQESVRHREQELLRNRELSQIKKQSRKNESRIKALEAEKRLKENALRRKTEEVSALRKERRISQKGGLIHEKKSNSHAMKRKWQLLEKRITKVALNRQTVSQMENDMERWLKDREKLSHKLEKVIIKRRRLAMEKGQGTKVLDDLDDQIENLKANVNYLHENIMECQQNIVQMEQADNPEEEVEEGVAKVMSLQDLRLDEAKYLLEKLLNMTINQCCLATQKDTAIKEMENRMNQVLKQNTLHQQLLQHMIEQQDLEIYDLLLKDDQGTDESDSDSDDLMTSSVINAQNVSHLELPEDVASDSSFGRREKARRKMTTKEDLLFNDIDSLPEPYSLPSTSPLTPASRTQPFQRSLSFVKSGAPESLIRSRSFIKPAGLGTASKDPRSMLGTADLMTQSVDQSIISRLAPVYQPSPVVGRRSLDRNRADLPVLRKFNSAAKLNDASSASPPGSPTNYRRQVSRGEDTDKNVFHRLVAGTNIGESTRPGKGVINPFQGRIAPRSPLVCTSVAEGHSKAVLSVFATDDLLFTASKDRTVKVWDLCRKEEVQSLAGHPNNVAVVKYSESMRLAFTTSSAFVKVWDLRMSNNVSCIKTLSSSGLTTNGCLQLSSGHSRTLVMPTGENQINDVCLTPSGYGLFTAAADKVRIWDLRKFHSIGKLSGGHQAAVMCLTSGSSGDAYDGDYVITGSKDHYIKVFNVSETKGGVVTPTLNLDPPHYDGIECLALSGDVLFSASRDTCIKKWNLRSQEFVRSVNNAHKDWICGLCFLPGAQILVSGCRAGHLKLWSVETCALVGEMKAHNATINTVAVNSNHIFTGSNDGSVGMWRVKNNFDRSPDSESS